jgi:cell division protein ZipA
MQKELQITLSIIGILIIGGVLIHGMWTIRKSSKTAKRPRLEPDSWDQGLEQEDTFDSAAPVYDDVVVSKAHVMNNSEDTGTDAIAESVPVSLQQNAREEIAVDEELRIDGLSTSDPLTESLHDDVENLIAKEYVNKEKPSQHTDYQANEDNAESYIKPVSVSDEDIGTLNINMATEPDESLGEPTNQSENKKEEGVGGNSPAVVKPGDDAPLYSNVVTRPKPEFSKPVSDNHFGHPPGFLLKKDAVDDFTREVEVDSQREPARSDYTGNEHQPLDSNKSSDFSLNIQEGPKVETHEPVEKLSASVEKELSFTQQAKRFVTRNKKTVAEKIRKEPLVKDTAAKDQMRIDFEESQSINDKKAATSEKAPATRSNESAKSISGETDVLVLNVRASDEYPINGASLLPMLLTLGFKFGDHDIFHRHVSTNGKGPILFSLTNMFKPGVFDIDNIENFNTYGLSLFMMLPIEGDPQQVFNMMHNAARKLSDEFGCRMLDGNKVGLSKQSLQQYVERIREFERRRIAKSS